MKPRPTLILLAPLALSLPAPLRVSEAPAIFVELDAPKASP